MARTFAAVEVESEGHWWGLAGLVRQLLDGRRFEGRVPGLSTGSLLRAHLASVVRQVKRPARALLRLMPRGVETRVRTLYSRRIRPHMSER